MATTAMTNYVIEVDEANFATEVIQRSQTTPVVVDFWAAWCGPCRVLGPVLEKLAQEFQGKFILAKVDVDRNQRLAMQYQVQGIPAVKAFVEGNVVGEFTGAQPEDRVRGFLEKLVPSMADMYARQGYEWEMTGQLAMAVTNYQGALEEEPDHYPAMVGLGRALMKQNKVDEAVEVLSRIPEGTNEWRVADALLATAQFQHHVADHTEADLEATLAANPNNIEARFRLACFKAINQEFEAALEAFLMVVQRDRQYDDDGARKAMLALFTTLGEDHPLTKTYRNRLASALF